MNYKIREATLVDYEAINLLVKEVHDLHLQNRPDIYNDVDNPLDKNYYEELINNANAKIFVVEYISSRKLIAYTILNVMETPKLPILIQRKFVFMNDLCVKDTYRGKGIGKLLFNRAIEFTKEIKGSSLELGVWEFNKDAIKFYESVGMNTKNKRMEIKIV